MRWQHSGVDLDVADYEFDGKGAESSVAATVATDVDLLLHHRPRWLFGGCVVGTTMFFDVLVGEHDLPLTGELPKVPRDAVSCVVAAGMPSVMDVDVELEFAAQHASRRLHTDGGSSASSTFRQGSLLVYSGDRIIFMLPRGLALGKV